MIISNDILNTYEFLIYMIEQMGKFLKNGKLKSQIL